MLVRVTSCLPMLLDRDGVLHSADGLLPGRRRGLSGTLACVGIAVGKPMVSCASRARRSTWPSDVRGRLARLTGARLAA